MASLRVDSDLDRLAGGAERAARIVPVELLKGMTAIVADGEREAKLTAPVNRGFYAATIAGSAAIAGSTITGKVEAGGGVVNYAAVINKGRRPGARMPPLDAIRAYLMSVGGNPDNAYIVARAIARRGITARPHIRTAVQRAVADSPRHIRPAIRRITEQLGGR